MGDKNNTNKQKIFIKGCSALLNPKSYFKSTSQLFWRYRKLISKMNVIARSSRTTTPLRESTKKSTSPKFGKAKRRRRTSPWRHHLTNLSGNTLHTFHCQSYLQQSYFLFVNISLNEWSIFEMRHSAALPLIRLFEWFFDESME